MTELINRDLLAGNCCFGCGHDNPDGLKIEVTRDPEAADRLTGIFEPKDYMTGIPGIIHGGAIFTALDCMAAWAPTYLRRETRAIWILRSASIKYHRPARQGQTLLLSSLIVEETGEWAPVIVRAEARDREGTLLAEGSFKLLPLGREKFKAIAGIDELPENWRHLLEPGRRG